MLEIVVQIVSFFITVPIIASFIVYIGSMIRERNKLKAVHMVVNWTTLLYIVAVSIMLTLIFEMNLVGAVMIFLILTLSIIIFVQWKKKRDVQFKKALKLLWRLSFLIFFLLYGCLMVVGIVKYLLA